MMNKIGVKTSHVTVWSASQKFFSYPRLSNMIRAVEKRTKSGNRYLIEQYAAKILKENLDKQFLTNVYWECARRYVEKLPDLKWNQEVESIYKTNFQQKNS